VVGRCEGRTDDRQQRSPREIRDEQAQGHTGHPPPDGDHQLAAPPTVRVIRSSPTASRSTAPRNTLSQKLLTFIRSRPLAMVATSKPPRTVPETETRPPESNVPPIAGRANAARPHY